MSSDKTHRDRTELSGDDAQVVDLLTAVLVDPNLHTDLRMRLHEEIRRMLGEIEESRSRGLPTAKSQSTTTNKRG